MAPKRKAADAEEVVAEAREARPSRAAKAVRTNNDDKPTKEKTTRTRSKKEPLPSKDEFTAGALPLHVNVMHNPPPIDQVSAASQAAGYGWKGSKKLYVELENSEGPDKKKVWVQLNINATVVGSKPTDEEDEDKEEEKPVPVEGQD